MSEKTKEEGVVRTEPKLHDLLDDEVMRLWMKARGNRSAEPIHKVLAEVAERFEEQAETDTFDSPEE